MPRIIICLFVSCVCFNGLNAFRGTTNVYGSAARMEALTKKTKLYLASASTSGSGMAPLWEELHGNYVLRPSGTSTQEPPRALVHFLGGAFVGASPDLTYRYLLETLCERGRFVVVATPYCLSFDYLQTCDAVLEKFERVAPMLARQYGAIPVIGVGHSCGSLLHLLITSVFPDTPRAANALMSYNNGEVGDAVPFFEEVFRPLFASAATSENNGVTGTEALRLVLELARVTSTHGRLPDDESLQRLVKAWLPSTLGSTVAAATEALLSEQLKDTLSSAVLQPLSDLSPPGVARGVLDVLEQIPSLIDEVASPDFTGDFVPPRKLVRAAAKRAYRARRTLLLEYRDDPIDESPDVEELLAEAERTMRMKRPMVTMEVQRIITEGNHATPCLAPPGLETARRIESVLPAEATAPYGQVDETVRILVEWFEETQL